MMSKLHKYYIPLATSCLLTGVAVSPPMAVAAESPGLNSADVSELVKRLQTMEAQLASSQRDISQLKAALAEKVMTNGASRILRGRKPGGMMRRAGDSRRLKQTFAR
jgi:hypothetical protein